MRGLNFRSGLLGIGLGLVCASIIYIAFFNGAGAIAPIYKNGSGENAAGENAAEVRIEDGGITDYAFRPLLAAKRVILLDGDSPRLLAESDKTGIGEEMLALTDEIKSIAINSAKPEVVLAAAYTILPAGESTEAATTAAAATTTAAAATKAAAATAAVTTQAKTTARTAAATTAAPTRADMATQAETTTQAETATQTETATQAETTTQTETTTQAAEATTIQATPASGEQPVTTIIEALPAPAAAAQITQATTQTDNLLVEFTIVRGQTATAIANNLLNHGLIADKNEFLDRLSDLKLTGELLDGTYQLPYNLDLNTLIDKITVHK